MSSYREEVCNKDEKGVPLFSPYCKPGRTVDNTLTSQITTPATLLQYNEKEKEMKGYSTFGEINCFIPPVSYPVVSNNKYNDKESASDWFQDLTYAQRISMKLQGIPEETKENPSLQLYHTTKNNEKVAISLFQTG